jgi:hypothetical protein
MFGQIAAIVRYVPPKASTAGSHALSDVVGHKMNHRHKMPPASRRKAFWHRSWCVNWTRASMK